MYCASIPNQISLMELLNVHNDYVGKGAISSNSSSLKSEEELLKEYLYNGERIASLAREKSERETNLFVQNDFFDQIIKKSYFAKTVSARKKFVFNAFVKLTRDMWEKCKSASVVDNELINYLKRYLNINAEVITDGSRPELDRLIKCFLEKRMFLLKE